MLEMLEGAGDNVVGYEIEENVRQTCRGNYNLIVGGDIYSRSYTLRQPI